MGVVPSSSTKPLSFLKTSLKSILLVVLLLKDLPGSSVVKNPPASAGDTGSISPGEGNGKPLQYSCLGNPVDRGT